MMISHNITATVWRLSPIKGRASEMPSVLISTGGLLICHANSFGSNGRLPFIFVMKAESVTNCSAGLNMNWTWARHGCCSSDFCARIQSGLSKLQLEFFAASAESYLRNVPLTSKSAKGIRELHPKSKAETLNRYGSGLALWIRQV